MVSTAFYLGKEKLRHSLGRPSRSDFVQFEFGSEGIVMKDWQKLIGAIIIALAIVGASLILADAIQYLGDAINAGLFGIANRL